MKLFSHYVKLDVVLEALLKLPVLDELERGNVTGSLRVLSGSDT